MWPALWRASSQPAVHFHLLWRARQRRRRARRAARLTTLTPRPVPHRPAPRRRVTEHGHVSGRGARRAGSLRRAAVAHHPRDDDPARSPLVPVLAPLRVTPPVRPLNPMGTIRTRVRLEASLRPQAVFRIRRPCAAPALAAPRAPARCYGHKGPRRAVAGAGGAAASSARRRCSPECGSR